MMNRFTTISDIRSRYRRLPSLSESLPWIAYQDDYCILADGISLGAGFEIQSIDCEGQSDAFLSTIAEKLTRCLQSLPQCKAAPWIVQCFLSSENPLDSMQNNLQTALSRQDNAFTQQHQFILQQHWQYLARPQGAFTDHTVTGQRFVLQQQRIQFFIYRHGMQGVDNKAALDQVCNQFTQQCQALGCQIIRMTGDPFYQTLLRWFNPNTPYLPHYPQQAPFGWELGTHCFLNTPISFEDGWLLDGMAHRVLPIQGLMMPPPIGLITHALQGASLWDQLPSGSLLTWSIVIEHQDIVRAHLGKIGKSAVGGHGQALQIKEEIALADGALAKGSCLFPCVMNLYLRAKTREKLQVKTSQAQATLVSQGLSVIDPAHLLCPADAYLRYLPFCYDYRFDQRYLSRAQYLFAQHIAHLLPLYGRSTGTQANTPLFYNRSGAPFYFNPLTDHRKNPHLLVLGETGTGKSNLLVHLLAQALAAEKPRVFIIEAGGSFDLFADFLKAQGLSVNHVKIDPTQPVSLNPFAGQLEPTGIHCAESASAEKHAIKTPPAGEHRDRIGEMAISAQLMITGGDPNETLSRQDKLMIVEALLEASALASQEKCQLLAQDIVHVFETQDWRDAHKKVRAREMADGLRYFCLDPLSNAFFNTPGDPWPLVDVTIVDFGLFASRGYEAHRAIAFAGCYHHMLALAEKGQASDRRMIAAFDENHLFTKIPLLAELQTRLAKMGRKLGLALWLLTQNMADFPDEAHKMLAMLETFICLALPPDEIAQVERFKPLRGPQHQLLLSAQKTKGQYTEGVILSPALTALFRHIPPKAYLALAGTEQQEKHARAQIMAKTGAQAWEAALQLAQQEMRDA